MLGVMTSIFIRTSKGEDNNSRRTFLSTALVESGYKIIIKKFIKIINNKFFTSYNNSKIIVILKENFLLSITCKKTLF